MLLSSLRRLRLYCTGQAETIIPDTVVNNRILHNWLGAVSADIEAHLDRSLHIEARTQYFDVDYGRKEFWVNAYPILTSPAPDLYEESEGLWDGNETQIDDPVFTHSIGRITLPYMLGSIGSKVLRVRYTGGLAYDATQSIITLAAGAGTFTAGKYIVGQTSGAVGIVTAYSSLSLTIEQYYGQLSVGETVSQYEDEATTPSSPSVTGTISAFARESLLNSHPNIILACEAQVRYMRQHQMDFENSGTQKDGVTIRDKNPMHLRFPLREEAMDRLWSYVRTWGD